MVRLAAVSDIHYRKDSEGMLRDLFVSASREADVLLLCGDLTDHGLLDEAAVLAQDLQRFVRIPVLAVLGNHDHDAGHPEEVNRILADVGVQLIDGNCTVIDGVGFAGVKGYVGGFDERALGPFGEAGLKHLVQESVDEALRLESALARIEVPHKVVLTHYAPIRATVEGEPLEIFPFLGSSRLEDPLNHYHVDLCFHGHAHRGAFEGRTTGGTRVFNVALHVIQRAFPDGPGYYLHAIGG